MNSSNLRFGELELRLRLLLAVYFAKSMIFPASRSSRTRAS